MYICHLFFEAVYSAYGGVFVVAAVEEHRVAAVGSAREHGEQDDHHLQTVLAAVHKVAVEHVLIAGVR